MAKPRLEQTRALLAQHGQEHVLRFHDELPAAGRQRLLAQLAGLDWGHLDDWIKTYVVSVPKCEIPTDLEPAPYFPAEPQTAAQRDLYAKAQREGEGLLRGGQIAAFTVAGGQGTRLGYDGPKGTFAISPVRKKPLFQLFAESLRRHGEIYGRPIPWYLMTSPTNDGPTRAFFAEHKYFGLAREHVTFFIQGQMPAFDFQGKLLLAAKDSLAMSPDGHGGSLRALHQSGALADMKSRGVLYISYFQVDNPLVSVVSPLFLGLHHLEQSQMSNRMLAKRDAFEKLGLFCRTGGKLQVIEYSDLPEALAVQQAPDGNLRFIAGSPAIHVISREFVEALNRGGFSLPWHRAVKKIPCVDAGGHAVSPTQPNGVKLESFVFDALPLARQTMILEAIRDREFAPVKNPDGQDSPASCRALMQAEFARWLEARGVQVPRRDDGQLTCTLEISPRSYVATADFQQAPLPTPPKPGTEVYLE